MRAPKGRPLSHPPNCSAIANYVCLNNDTGANNPFHSILVTTP